MSNSESAQRDRRSAIRYRVPGHARVFWPGGIADGVSLADMSVHGCLVAGSTELPDAGTRVFLSLDVAGLPNLRLPATTVRKARQQDEHVAAIRFDVPPQSTEGLNKLLAQFEENPSLHPLDVILIDSEDRSRERIAHAVRQSGAQVVPLSNAIDAVNEARKLRAGVAMARCDAQGLLALSVLSIECPNIFRIGFGRGSALETAVALGIVQATADDPSSAKCLSRLLDRTPS